MESISSKDGAPIACWHSGAGEPLLLVHGTSGDHFAWASVLPALECHFSVWTIDRRGRGHSGDTDSYAFERECEDIATVIDAIGSNVHVLGHSFGGLCALEAALLTPNIGRLILYEPSLSLVGSGWSAKLDARMQILLGEGNREEALLLFFRDIVKLPPREIADSCSSYDSSRIAQHQPVHFRFPAVLHLSDSHIDSAWRRESTAPPPCCRDASSIPARQSVCDTSRAATQRDENCA